MAATFQAIMKAAAIQAARNQMEQDAETARQIEAMSLLKDAAPADELGSVRSKCIAAVAGGIAAQFKELTGAECVYVTTVDGTVEIVADDQADAPAIVEPKP